ncbi:Uncharacterised protein [Vibrio cholerae]|nr:Uncharacterised protein [Vibrio cholerae]
MSSSLKMIKRRTQLAYRLQTILKPVLRSQVKLASI